MARLLEVVEQARAKQRAREQALAKAVSGMRWTLRYLTCREQEVLDWLAEGRTDPEIARTLAISKRTAHRHVSNLRRKLGVRNRVQAAVLWERYKQEGATSANG